MSQSAVSPGPVTLSGVLRIALFEEDDDVRASFVAWPGDRVETNALLMPATPSIVPPAAIVEPVVHAPGSEPLVTVSAAWAALLAVLVLTAGAAAVTPVVAFLLFP
ncbi:MAG: hypothetical protein JWM74_3754 [Myxococcaceae bacterium]|nr:hypothetical protein [Myxococcaceae bacterium]